MIAERKRAKARKIFFEELEDSSVVEDVSWRCRLQKRSSDVHEILFASSWTIFIIIFIYRGFNIRLTWLFITDSASLAIVSASAPSVFTLSASSLTVFFMSLPSFIQKCIKWRVIFNSDAPDATFSNFDHSDDLISSICVLQVLMLKIFLSKTPRNQSRPGNPGLIRTQNWSIGCGACDMETVRTRQMEPDEESLDQVCRSLRKVKNEIKYLWILL